MKRKQLAAIMLSAIMAVSACVPVNGISAAAAENTGAESTETSTAAEALNEAVESVTEAEDSNEQGEAEEALEAPARVTRTAAGGFRERERDFCGRQKEWEGIQE